MKNKEERDTRLDEIKLFLREEGFKISEVIGVNDVIFEQHYGDIKEYIEVELYRLSDLYSAVRIGVTEIDFNEEIVVAESCHECQGEYCDYWDIKEEICTLDTEEVLAGVEKTLLPKVTVDFGWNREIIYEEVIESEKCYVNIPHNHYYKAENYSFICDEAEEAISFLKLREQIKLILRRLSGEIRRREDTVKLLREKIRVLEGK